MNKNITFRYELRTSLTDLILIGIVEICEIGQLTSRTIKIWICCVKER